MFILVGIPMVVLVAVVVSAIATRRELARATLVAVILVASFFVPPAMTRAISHRRLKSADPALLRDSCRDVWGWGMDTASEQVRSTTQIMFFANAALSIIAVSPRRKGKPA